MPSRRQFLTAGAGAAAAFALPDAAWARRRPRRLRGGRFAQGVLSGEPSPDAITLLTVLDDVGGRGSVRVEVARDPGFRRLVAVGDIQTSAERHHSVKARIFGLEPSQEYHYRFETRGSHSAVGRFRTAPAPDSRQPIRFAVFSCANWAFGHYNAYELMAREDDLDFVVNLGDYVYAESDSGGRNARADRIGREIDGDRQAVTLADYRAKYALYRTDPALRHMHARHAMVSIWDDHEVMNNYANDAEDGGLPLRRRFSRARRDAAYQAWFEAMPVFSRSRSQIYRTQSHGRTVELIMLDERQYRANQPCGDALAFPCSTWDRQRTILGRKQLAFLQGRLQSSPAAWKVVGGQSLIMPNRVHDGQYARYDSWQGYPQEREHLLNHIASNGIKDVIFLSGDVHTFVAGDVGTQMGAGPSVAVEFAAGSVTSANVGESNYRMPGGQLIPGNDAEPRTPPGVLEHYRAVNPWFDAIDLDHHGYGVAMATQSAFYVTLKRLWTVKERNAGTMPDTGFSWKVARGQTSIKGTAR
jgi:alkaline phosphatase D